MPRPSLTIFLSLLVAVLLSAGAYFAEGFWQAALLGLATVFITLAASEGYTHYRAQLERPVFYITLLTVMIALFVAATLYLAYALISLTRVAPFPNDGLIANFRSGPGGHAYTAQGTQCSLISDSAFNLDSRVWYKRLDSDSDGNGFLRLGFELKSATDSAPYVGLSCAFSFPPTIVYDASMYKSLQFKLRVSPEVLQDHLAIGVALYSKDLPEGLRRQYAFPSWRVDDNDLSTQWKTYTVPFSWFHAPKYANADISLDPAQIFQMGFVVTGKARADLTGSIDLTDIRFTKD